MSSDKRVEFTQDGALGILTLDNPPLNLISADLIGDLLDAIGEVETAPEVRALLVRGNGKVFSAGADVALFAGKSADEMRPLINSFLHLGRRIERLPFPTPSARGVSPTTRSCSESLRSTSRCSSPTATATR